MPNLLYALNASLYWEKWAPLSTLSKKTDKIAKNHVSSKVKTELSGLRAVGYSWKFCTMKLCKDNFCLALVTSSGASLAYEGRGINST